MLRGPLLTFSYSASGSDMSRVARVFQIHESRFLDEARKRTNTHARIEFYGDLLVIAVATTVVGRVGYYCIYGKPGGAAALPKIE